MNWQPADTIAKPPKYERVLLSLLADEYTTGHWSGKDWVGFAGNQSPPFYIIEPGLVTHWCLIEQPEGKERTVKDV